MSDAPLFISRQSLNRGWLRIGLAAGLLLVLIGAQAALRWERGQFLSINWTESLPFWAFVIDRTVEPDVGDYVEFIPPANDYYQDVAFVKQIVAGPGDEITCLGRAFYLGDTLIAIAKTHSRDGDPLSLGPCGVVPDDRYFVTTPHTDSFDSRYGEIGYVSRSAIRGVARPIL